MLLLVMVFNKTTTRKREQNKVLLLKISSAGVSPEKKKKTWIVVSLLTLLSVFPSCQSYTNNEITSTNRKGSLHGTIGKLKLFDKT